MPRPFRRHHDPPASNRTEKRRQSEIIAPDLKPESLKNLPFAGPERQVPLRVNRHSSLGLIGPGRGSLFLVAALDLFRRHILDMSSNPPVVALRIFDAATAIAVRLVGWLLHGLPASRDRLLVNCVHVLDVQVQIDGPWRPRLAGLPNHDHRISDAYFRMANAALVVRVAIGFLGAEGLLQKIDLRFRIRHRQVRRDCVITLRNWFDCHGLLLRVSFEFRVPSLTRFASASHFGPSYYLTDNSPSPSLFFRISALRTFALQPIEAQWFTSNFFVCVT